MLISVILIASLLWVVSVHLAFRRPEVPPGGVARLGAHARWWIAGAVLIPMFAFAACLIATWPVGTIR